MNSFKFLLRLCCLLGLFIANSYANTSVWKISKNQDYFYLGGTIHVLNKADYPLPKAFEQAYKDADTLVFETNLDAGNQAEHQAKFMASMMFHDKRTLASELTPNMYAKLKGFLTSRNIPIEHFAQYQPWGVSLMLTIMEYQRLGMVSEFGVDNYFNNKARAENKPIESLETFDEQIGFLQSLADIDPNTNIEYTLQDIDNMPQWIVAMKQAWRSGQVEDFTDMKPVQDMKHDFPEVYKTIIVNRNQNWLPEITNYINDKDVEFVLVGAMHLNGKEGLLNQLTQQGFQVEHL